MNKKSLKGYLLDLSMKAERKLPLAALIQMSVDLPPDTIPALHDLIVKNPDQALSFLLDATRK